MKTAGVDNFSNRLDEIFEQYMPTKAQIIDAFNKFASQSTPDNRDKIIEKQREIIHDMFYQTGYSNGKLHKELSALQSVTTKDLIDDDEAREDAVSRYKDVKAVDLVNSWKDNPPKHKK